MNFRPYMAYNRTWLAADNKGFWNRSSSGKMSSQEPADYVHFHFRDRSGEIFYHHRSQAISSPAAGSEASRDDSTVHAKVSHPI
ncbi:hypothetical protein T265_13656, partial [Opisthorchis viverrini]